jgi:hypothetical protein
VTISVRELTTPDFSVVVTGVRRVSAQMGALQWDVKPELPDGGLAGPYAQRRVPAHRNVSTFVLRARVTQP